MRRLLALGALGSLLASAPAALADAAKDGAAHYQRCAACHLPTGAGVPGAFPPLGADFRALAVTPPGREYLALVVIKGLMGPLTVDGKRYVGVMPAQPLDDAGVAAVLNHVATTIAKVGEGFQPYTADEVAAVRAAGKGLTSADVAKRHAVAGGK